MDERLVRFFENKKFMWDGAVCTDEDQATKKKERYLDDGFEVQTVHDGANVLLFTRRIVTA